MEGFRIRLRRDLQIVRHYSIRGIGVHLFHFGKVHGQPPFALFTMFAKLLPNQSVNGTSKCRTLFLIGSGVGPPVLAPAAAPREPREICDESIPASQSPWSIS